MPKARSSDLLRRFQANQQAIADRTGVTVAPEDPIPEFYRRFFRHRFEADLGDGDFTFNWAPPKAPTPNVRFQTFIGMVFRVEGPCTRVAIRQSKKIFVFERREGGFEFQPGDSQPTASTDTPPGDANEGFLDPGEVESRGNGQYYAYDPAGPPSGLKPADVTAIRVRVAFKVEVLCDGVVVDTFYWIYEATLPYTAGKPMPYGAGSAVAQISKADYDDPKGYLRADHPI